MPASGSIWKGTWPPSRRRCSRRASCTAPTTSASCRYQHPQALQAKLSGMSGGGSLQDHPSSGLPRRPGDPLAFPTAVFWLLSSVLSGLALAVTRAKSPPGNLPRHLCAHQCPLVHQHPCSWSCPSSVRSTPVSCLILSPSCPSGPPSTAF